MKKYLIFLFATFMFQFAWSQSNSSYLPSDIVTGMNSNNDYLLKQDEEKRKKEIFKDYKIPPKYEIPEFKSVEKKRAKASEVISEDNIYEPSTNTFNEPTSIQSSYPSVSQVEKKSSSQSVGQTVTIPYDKSMDKFINGVYGYNPNLTIMQNEEYYRKNGYSISYKVKDSTIFMIGGIILILIIIGFVYSTNRVNHNEKFKTQD